jgi:beta-galactosidase
MGGIVKTSERIIVEAERKAQICVLFYPPYYATELERPETGTSGLKFNASSIRRPAYFDGLLKVLQVLNIEYDMADLTKTTPEQLKKYSQVWVFSTDEMNARDQHIIVDYITEGGQAVVYPSIPDREMSQKPCTIIRDAISIHPTGFETIDSPLIDLFDLKDIKCANPQLTYSEEILAGAEVIARTIRGTACGFTKPLGKGSIIHIGTWLGFDTESHKPAYTALLNLSGAKLRNASADSENMVVRQRFTGGHSGLLFIANYYNEEQTGKVYYSHPGTGETIPVPFTQENTLWPALYGVLTPVCLEVSDSLKILHSTSDILDIKLADGRLEITVYGDRDLPGEIVLEGRDVENIKSACLDGVEVMLYRHDSRVGVSYLHRHKEESVLSISLKE